MLTFVKTKKHIELYVELDKRNIVTEESRL